MKGNTCALLVDRQIDITTTESSMKIPQKIRTKITIWSS